MKYLLTNRKIIQITGDDILGFLQGLITNDVKLLEKQNGFYSAMLTPNGRFLYDFFVISKNNEIFIDIADIFADSFIQTLTKYKLRRKIDFIKTSFNVISSPEKSDFSFQDNRFKSEIYRNIGNYEGREQNDEYNSFLIQNLIVDGRFIPQEKGIILEYDFEKLNGVSFEKGCYLGQELIQRTKRIGQIRKKIAMVKHSDNLDFITSDGSFAIVFEKDDRLG
ncbi:CAF17-like 4Fe-4S cluster assembly/insertion protein YgfZ [Candidatus Deianiraea vastatrix]|uniref:YgfZ-like folate-binding transferase n=1 Tax=Candidatus Deianiraea vastatrix TaxID=2163644 RepID=A0A5B8XEQ6_9RICK|nr:hypothetical protein [Candidatus Deianiraea vastatrix]QED23788.1 Putative YgfZ-like folate-binding transferase [Candidatus Deianiraea vastatrix]